MMKFASVCSGIEAASVAFNPLGWQAAWFSEIDRFPCQLLAYHYPNVPNHGDMTLLTEKIINKTISAPDILCGGTPCQAFSVAGKRQSLDDDRGNLTLTFCYIADAIDAIRLEQGQEPAIILWENVPGVLNTKDNAFGCFLAELAGEDEPLIPAGKRWTNAGCVFGAQRTVSWRVLDSQYFGVAQRRKRVFVVASARDGFDPTAVLFEFDGVRRDSAPSREPREAAAEDAGAGFTASSFAGYREGVGTLRANGGDLGGGSETLITTNRMRAMGDYVEDECASTMKSRDYKDATDLVVAFGIHKDAMSIGKPHHLRKDGHGNHLGVSKELAYTLTRSETNAVAFNITFCDANGTRADRRDGGLYVNQTDTANSLTCAGTATSIAHNMQVRRLTPIECERLQGFPDNYTDIKPNGKPTPDGSRYKALGNSWAVPVVRWIGERIVQAINKEQG